MSDPISGTGLAGGVLTGASVYELLTGTDYGVVFGAFIRVARSRVISNEV
ncbi:MAG: hypothetical protein CITR_02965 [Citrobacter freundii]|nr:hypothetical protein SK34_03322 [Citrobacter sp. MGH104]